MALAGACQRHEPSGTRVERCSARDADWFWILEAEVVQETLEIGVDFTGGCQSHAFRLCWDGDFRSEGPDVRLGVDHEDYDDDCDAGVAETHAFSLVPLADTWVADGGDVPTTLAIELSGPEGPYPDLLEYAF